MIKAIARRDKGEAHLVSTMVRFDGGKVTRNVEPFRRDSCLVSSQN
mgnify:FL=1